MTGKDLTQKPRYSKWRHWLVKATYQGLTANLGGTTTRIWRSIGWLIVEWKTSAFIIVYHHFCHPRGRIQLDLPWYRYSDYPLAEHYWDDGDLRRVKTLNAWGMFLYDAGRRKLYKCYRCVVRSNKMFIGTDMADSCWLNGVGSLGSVPLSRSPSLGAW